MSTEEAKDDFPNRGLITWLAPPPNLMKASVWQLRVEDQPSFEPDNPQHDAFKANGNPAYPAEVLDLRQYGGEESVRRILTEQGLHLSFIPSEILFLWIDHNHWVGPVHVSQTIRNGFWKLPVTHAGQPIPPLSLIQAASESNVAAILVDGHKRLFVAPHGANLPRLGVVDWAADDVVLRRALRSIKKYDAEYSRALELTDKAIEHAVQIISSEGSPERQQLERAVGIVSELKINRKLSDDVVEALLGVPAVASQLRKAEAESRQMAETKVRGELSGVLAEIESAKQSREQLLQELQRIKEEVQRSEQELQNQIDSVDAELSARLSEVMKRPEKTVAEIAVLRAAVGLQQEQRKQIDGTKPEPSTEEHSRKGFRCPPEWKSTGSIELDSKSNIRLRLATAFKSSGLSLRVARTLHSALLAGLLPVLSGPAALEAAYSYAAAMSGGRLLWLPVSPGTIDPGDLLGHIEPQTGTFIPAPGGLVDLLLHACTRSELYVVALDGINHAPTDSYLEPLLNCVRSAAEGRPRSLPLFNAAALRAGEDYRCAAWLEWPKNVLLIATLADGATTLTPKSSLWRQAALIQTGGVNPQEQGASQSNEISQISSSLWHDLRRKVSNIDKTPLINLLEHFRDGGMEVPTDIETTALKLFTFVCQWSTPPEMALSDSLECLLLPHSIVTGKTTEFADVVKKHCSNRSKELEALLASAKQVLPQ